MPALEKPDGPLTTNVKWRFPSVHPEGRKYVVGAGFVTLVTFLLGWEFLTFALLALTAWVAAFFRDPVRTTPRRTRSAPPTLVAGAGPLRPRCWTSRA